jgi:hypothetical protein
VGDAIEIVYVDSSANAAIVDAPILVAHHAISCLSSRDHSDFEFISVTRQGFLFVSLKSIDNRLNIIM